MNELVRIFVKMVQAGVQGGAAVGAVLLFRRLFFGKRSRNFCCVLWMLVFFRFLCPVTWITWNVTLPFYGEKTQSAETGETAGALQRPDVQKSAAGSQNAARPEDSETAEGTTARLSSQEAEAGAAAGAGSREDANVQAEAEKPAAAAEAQAGRAGALARIALIWLAGAAVLLAFAAAQYLGLKRRLRFAVKCELFGREIWETDQAREPFVMGILKPEIYLPAGLPKKEKYHIVVHESAHIARRDYLVKLICYLGVIIQWMNPLAWAAFYFYNQDMEMACDERAVRALGQEERLDYSRTLLTMAARGSGLGLPVFFGESNAKRRVKNILQKKKKTLAGGLLAAVFICGLAILLFTGSGGESGGAKKTADAGRGTDGAANWDGTKEEGSSAAAQSGQYDAEGIEACAFAQDGQLKVMVYNFTGWNHIYVSQTDFRVERQKENGWETVEPDLSVNRISSQPGLLQVRWPRELGGLLLQYESELEDGAYRLVLYCQDTPVEDPQLSPGEVYAPFAWKDGAPAEEEAMLQRMEAVEMRYQETDFPGKATFIYSGETLSGEEEAARREEENEALRAGDEELLKLYEEKLRLVEARMEAAAEVQKAAYYDFCEVLQGEMAQIGQSMNNLGDTWIDGENVTQARLEYEAEIAEKEEELSNLQAFIEVRESLQDKLWEEIEEAEEKQELTDYYNQKTEFIQQLYRQRYLLQEELERLKREEALCRMQELAGYDLAEEQRQRLSQLLAGAGNGHDILVLQKAEDGGAVRDALYQFWLKTEGTGKLPATLSAAEADGQIFVVDEGEQEPGTGYGTVKSMTFTFGEETEEGGLTVTSVTAWGDGYLILVDQSGNAQRDSAAEETEMYCYDCLYWLSGLEGGLEAAVASDEPGLTYEQFMNSLLSSTWDGGTDYMVVAMF